MSDTASLKKPQAPSPEELARALRDAADAVLLADLAAHSPDMRTVASRFVDDAKHKLQTAYLAIEDATRVPR